MSCRCIVLAKLLGGHHRSGPQQGEQRDRSQQATSMNHAPTRGSSNRPGVHQLIFPPAAPAVPSLPEPSFRLPEPPDTCRISYPPSTGCPTMVSRAGLPESGYGVLHWEGGWMALGVSREGA